jgi:hypothetical protein
MKHVQEQDKIKQLCFSGPHIDAKFAENVRNYAIQGNCEFIYPWHQYYADTDCIWLAIEYHPYVR